MEKLDPKTEKFFRGMGILEKKSDPEPRYPDIAWFIRKEIARKIIEEDYPMEVH